MIKHANCDQCSKKTFGDLKDTVFWTVGFGILRLAKTDFSSKCNDTQNIKFVDTSSSTIIYESHLSIWGWFAGALVNVVSADILISQL